MKASTVSQIVAGSLFLTGAPAAKAQQIPGAVDQFDAARRRKETEQSLLDAYKNARSAPELYPGELTDVGPQAILRPKPRRTYFEALADSQFFYTDNLLLQEENGSGLTDTSVWVNTAQVALAPSAFNLGPGKFAPRLGYRHQWFNYGLGDEDKRAGGLPVSFFDFDVQTVFTDGRYRLGENWILTASVEWNRLLSHNPSYTSYTQFYQEFVPQLTVQRLFPLSETRVFSLAYQGNYRFSDTRLGPAEDVNDRTDQIFFAAYTHTFNPHWVAQPYYRFQYTRYTAANDRNDALNTFGFSLYYFFNEKCSARLFVNYDLKESDDPIIADYRKLDAGLGLNLNFRF